MTGSVFFAVGDDDRWTIFRSVETPITESLSHPIQVIQMQPVRLCFLLYKCDEETFKPHSGEKSNLHDQWLSLFRWRQFDKCNQWPEVFFIRCGPQWPLNNLQSGGETNTQNAANNQMQPVRLCFLLYKRDEETFKPHSGEKSNLHDQWLSLFRWRQFDKYNQWPEVFFIRCGPQWPLNNL